jgi:hypothetical protein
MKYLFLVLLFCGSVFGQNITNLYVGQQMYVGMQLTTVPSAAGGGATVPGIFIDAIVGDGGSDSNTGLSNSPVATLAKSLSLYNGSSATNFYLKSGGTNYESFVVPPNCTLDWYGPNIGYPVISGVTNLNSANFTLTAGTTNTYQIALLVPPFTNGYVSSTFIHTNVLMVFQTGTNMARYGSGTYCVRLGARWDYNAAYSNSAVAVTLMDTHPFSFYWASNTQVLYINPGTNSLGGPIGNPATNGFLYEAAIRSYCVVGTTNTLVQHIQAEKCYAYNGVGEQGYQLMGTYSGTFNHCKAFMGWNHLVGNAPSNPTVGTNNYFNINAYGMENPLVYATPGTMYVSDASNATNNPVTVFSNCLAGMDFPIPMYYTNTLWGNGSQPWQSVGFFCHEQTQTFVYFYNCVATNCYLGINLTTNASIDTRCVAQNCFHGLAIADATNSVNGFTAYSCSYGIFAGSGAGLKSIVNNCMFWQVLATGIYIPNGSQLFATNNIFANTNFTAPNSIGTGISMNGNASFVTSVSNSFYQLQKTYLYGDLINSDHNNYYWNILWYNYTPYLYLGNNMTTNGSAQFNVYDYQSYKATWTNYFLCDNNSTTNNPGYAYSNWIYQAVDPSGP